MRPLGVATKWPAVILYIQWTLAQTTVYERNTLGLVVQEENDPPVTVITCPNDGELVYENRGGIKFCAPEGDTYAVPYDCFGDTLTYAWWEGSSSSDMSTSCEDTCTSVTIVEEYSAGGSTYTHYDCAELYTDSYGMPSGVETMFLTVPPDAFPTTTETTSTTSSAQTTTTTASENDDRDDDDGPNVPVIVGATVGSVVGVALIIAGVCVGIRLGRKRASPTEDPNVRQSSHTFPRPTIVWKQAGSDRVSKQETPVMHQSPMMQQQSPAQTLSPTLTAGGTTFEGHHPAEYVSAEHHSAYTPSMQHQSVQPHFGGHQQVEHHPVELPSDAAAQGWAVSDVSTYRHEMASPKTDHGQ